MEELIKKSDAIKNIDELWVKWRTDGTGHIHTPFVGEVAAVDCCKTAVLQTQAVESKQGEWIINDAGDTECSVCGETENKFIYGTESWYGKGESRFCPNCGARMKGINDEG